MQHTPVTMEQLKSIGHIVKTFGYDGEYIVFSDYDQAIEHLEFAFIEIDGLPVPFKLYDVTYHKNNTWRMKLTPILEDLDFTGQTLYATKDDLLASFKHEDLDPDSKEFFIEDLIGFDVIDTETDKVLGQITGIEGTTANKLFVVSRADDKDSELLIPIVDEFVEYIEESSIGVTLPKGLLDL